jgi:hypothetical protein
MIGSPKALRRGANTVCNSPNATGVSSPAKRSLLSALCPDSTMMRSTSLGRTGGVSSVGRRPVVGCMASSASASVPRASSHAASPTRSMAPMQRRLCSALLLPTPTAGGNMQRGGGWVCAAALAGSAGDAAELPSPTKHTHTSFPLPTAAAGTAAARSSLSSGSCASSRVPLACERLAARIVDGVRSGDVATTEAALEGLLDTLEGGGDGAGAVGRGGTKAAQLLLALEDAGASWWL